MKKIEFNGDLLSLNTKIKTKKGIINIDVEYVSFLACAAGLTIGTSYLFAAPEPANLAGLSLNIAVLGTTLFHYKNSGYKIVDVNYHKNGSGAVRNISPDGCNACEPPRELTPEMMAGISLEGCSLMSIGFEQDFKPHPDVAKKMNLEGCNTELVKRK